MIIGKEELLNNHTSLPKENNITNEEIYIFFNKLMEEWLRNMDRLCLAQASETGKPIKNCTKELFRCIELIKYGIKCNSEAEVKVLLIWDILWGIMRGGLEEEEYCVLTHLVLRTVVLYTK